ncbi:division/cell wall cluster transcriptional repressor MraZ [Chachezhania sediminis]|uniref:division/cell wall cluster transcriptional repressor MraZ n=1 Tax=Chachezhania sediminis TaxID=2599291 RepID=UPI001E6500BA|nr:division/cell wall cluster transcriptional repressor MraZ [Chachezhania sediminis]
MSGKLRFRGESSHKVDSKGRVSIPAHFRRVLEEGDPEYRDAKAAGVSGASPNVVIVYGNSKKDCLDCYTVEAMREIEEKIAKMPAGQAKRVMEYIFHGKSAVIAVDDSGRLVLSAKLREKAKLTDMAYFISGGDHFKIWSPDVFEGAEAVSIEDWMDEQPDDFDPLELLNSVEV